jgi:hypothetical protein
MVGRAKLLVEFSETAALNDEARANTKYYSWPEEQRVTALQQVQSASTARLDAEKLQHSTTRIVTSADLKSANPQLLDVETANAESKRQCEDIHRLKESLRRLEAEKNNLIRIMEVKSMKLGSMVAV